MGIIVNDSIDTRFGNSLTEYYLAISDESIQVTKEQAEGTTQFITKFSAKVWISQDARNDHKSPVCVNTYYINHGTTAPTGDIYTLAYDHIKGALTSYTDSQ